MNRTELNNVGKRLVRQKLRVRLSRSRVVGVYDLNMPGCCMCLRADRCEDKSNSKIREIDAKIEASWKVVIARGL